MRDYVRRLLTSTGYEVEAVGDGLTALRVAQERKPDLIVTDVMMPELDGYGLLKWIRADPDLRQVPVIFLIGTGWRRSAYRRDACGSR